MKLSEVYKTKTWCKGRIFRGDDKCCIIGAIALANGIQRELNNDEQPIYDKLKDNDMAKKVADIIRAKTGWTKKNNVDVLWHYNDCAEEKDVMEVINEYSKLYEQEPANAGKTMATMNDVAGYSDLFDDDIFEVADSFVSKGHEFTAYDVTKELRSQNYWAEHSYVKDLVQQYAKDNNLAWQNREVRTGVYARVYQPTTNAVVIPSLQQVSPATTKVVLSPTNRGGVSLPTSLVKKLGVKPGDKVAVDCLNGLTVAPAALSLSGKKYSVDSSGRVVLTKAALALGNLNASSVVAYHDGGFTLKLKDK